MPDGGTPILTVRDGAEVPLRDAAGGHVVDVLTDTTEFDSPTVLSVAARQGNWIGVPTELLPNGELGWVKLDPQRLKIDSVGQSIVVDLSAMTGKLYRGGELERSWQVGIGAAATPTPTGRFSITDEIEGGLNPAYGCCAIALSATQPNLPAGWTRRRPDRHPRDLAAARRGELDRMRPQRRGRPEGADRRRPARHAGHDQALSNCQGGSRRRLEAAGEGRAAVEGGAGLGSSVRPETISDRPRSAKPGKRKAPPCQQTHQS